MSLRDQLTSIYQTQGELTPKLLVDVARDQSHPLHSRFEWDDSVAGEKYRQVQAAELIRSVKISFTERGGEEKHVRAFHAVARAESSTYMPIEEVVQDEFAKALVLRTAEREWRALRARYAHLSEFMDLVRGDVGEAGAA